MIAPPINSDEPLRLNALRRTHELDTPLAERFERITRLAQRLLRSPIAAISLVDADRQWFKSVQGMDITETSRRISFCGHTILQDDMLVVSDARADARFSDNPLVHGDPHIVFYAGCPLRSFEGAKIGSLCVIDHKRRRFSREDQQILRDLAAVAENELKASAHIAAQGKLIAEFNEVSLKSRVDSLTRVWNRESIFALLDLEIARSPDGGAAIIMADLDHFKQINDTRGHVAGDEVLRQAAKRMLGAIREVDSLGRYGGEEFMIVLSACDSLAGAEAMANRILSRINEAPFVTEFGLIPVTLSLGAAFGQSKSGMSGQALIRAADAALYKAKHRGRNRVESSLVENSDQGLKKAS